MKLKRKRISKPFDCPICPLCGESFKSEYCTYEDETGEYMICVRCMRGILKERKDNEN